MYGRFYRPIHKTMYEMREFNIGQKVYWNDPGGLTSGYYNVLDNHAKDYMNWTEKDIAEGDTRIILVENGVTEAEVYAGELQCVFDFYQDVKMTSWERIYFSIPANNEEDAINQVNTITSCVRDMEEYDSEELYTETLHDTIEPMTLEANKGYTTMEIYCGDGRLILENGN